MFLCDSCHAESTCTNGFIEGFLRSLGPCEQCHVSGPTRDCHGYGFLAVQEGDNA